MQKYGEKGGGVGGVLLGLVLQEEYPVYICRGGRDSSEEKIRCQCRPSTKLTDLSILLIIIIINHNP